MNLEEKLNYIISFYCLFKGAQFVLYMGMVLFMSVDIHEKSFGFFLVTMILIFLLIFPSVVWLCAAGFTRMFYVEMIILVVSVIGYTVVTSFEELVIIIPGLNQNSSLADESLELEISTDSKFISTDFIETPSKIFTDEASSNKSYTEISDFTEVTSKILSKSNFENVSHSEIPNFSETTSKIGINETFFNISDSENQESSLLLNFENATMKEKKEIKILSGNKNSSTEFNVNSKKLFDLLTLALPSFIGVGFQIVLVALIKNYRSIKNKIHEDLLQVHFVPTSDGEGHINFGFQSFDNSAETTEVHNDATAGPSGSAAASSHAELHPPTNDHITTCQPCLMRYILP